MNIQKTNIREDNQESVVRRFVQDTIISPEIKAIPDRQLVLTDLDHPLLCIDSLTPSRPGFKAWLLLRTPVPWNEFFRNSYIWVGSRIQG
jgi:hypothetical protein